MSDADAPSRDFEPTCFICEVEEADADPEAYICTSCMLEAVAEQQSNDRQVHLLGNSEAKQAVVSPTGMTSGEEISAIPAAMTTAKV